MEKTIEEQIADKEQEIVKLKEELAKLQTPFVEFPKWIREAGRVVQNAEEEAKVRAGLEAGTVAPASDEAHDQEVKRVEKAKDVEVEDPDDAVADHELSTPADKKDASKYGRKGR